MRTAEEIYESNVQYEWNDVGDMLKKSILSAIITAQKEAIEETINEIQLTVITNESHLRSLVNNLK